MKSSTNFLISFSNKILLGFLEKIIKLLKKKKKNHKLSQLHPKIQKDKFNKKKFKFKKKVPYLTADKTLFPPENVPENHLAFYKVQVSFSGRRFLVLQWPLN